MLLNLNVIHTCSNWLCWKAWENFQVEFRFCKTIGCSHITLLTTYLAKKTIFKVSDRNTKKRCLLISKITSERRHLTTSYLLELTENHVWTVFPRIYTNLQSKVCFHFCFQVRRPVISTIADPYMSFYEKWEIITEIFDSWKIQNVSIFYFWKNNPKNGNIFQIFTLYSKGHHFSITKLDILIFCNILYLGMDFWNLSWKRIVSS